MTVPNNSGKVAMSAEGSFSELMARLRAGDGDAATLVFERFAQRLIALARSRLDGVIRQKVDPEDVLQSVYRSFFSRQAQGQFDLQSWDGLWTMLTVLTVRKCGRRVEYFRAACRDVDREVTAAPTDYAAPAWEGVSHEPTPSEAALLAETVEQLMKQLPVRERDILALSLQGYTIPEISAQIGRTERTVQRVLKRVKETLEEMQAQT